MATEFRLPDIGEGIAEAEIVEWLVKEGDTVKADDVLVKVETDKAVADLPAPVGGTVLKINFAKGDTVNVGAVLCVIGEKGERADSKPVERVMKRNDVTVQKEKPRDVSVPSGKVLASPAVRKRAADLGVDLSSVKGSGEGGQIVMIDIDGGSSQTMAKKIEGAGASVQKKYDMFGYVERVSLKSIRKTIAQNMMQSLAHSAQVTSMEDIDVTKLWDIRQKEKEHFAIEGVKLTFMPFIIKAVIKALQEHPMLNSSLEGEDIVIKKYYNIGVAVETDAGLMVPVIKIAEKKSIADIAQEIADLAEKARSRSIDIMDLKGSTFTITNYGSVGGTYGTPIINPGEAAILGLGRIFDRAVFDEKTKNVSNAKILPVSLTFDHQILDGAQAARFIETLKGLLEDPWHLIEK